MRLEQSYQDQLGKELFAMGDSEMWQAGKAVRTLRPKQAGKKASGTAKGTKGRKSN
jgi:hypothetical protein